MERRRFANETELKQEVLRRVDDGTSYRELSGQTYYVSGKKTRVSPARITRWRKQARDGTTPVSNYKSHDRTSTSDGEIASAAFTLFEGGASPAQVVIEMKHAPDVISNLHDKWAELSGRLVLSADARSLIDSIGYGIEGQADLDLAMEKLVDDHFRHMSCPSELKKLEEMRRIKKIVDRLTPEQA